MQQSVHIQGNSGNFLKETRFSRPTLWIVFAIYLLISVYAMIHHEMWGDEIHSWNIAKGSAGFFDMISNSRYEGHPPVWYALLWTISKFTHDLAYVQAVHLLIASLGVYLLLFFSPFPFFTRVLLPFGYYFLFEYAILSRNYAIGVLLVFCICFIVRRHFRYKLPLYYFLLFLLCNTHLLAILLAGCLHLYFLFWKAEQGAKRVTIARHALLGLLVALPAIYFIFPPPDSQLNTAFWIDRWGIHKVSAFIQAPIRAFIPIPAWWDYHFWNTQFLIEAKENYPVLRFVNLFLMLGITALVIFVLKRSKKGLVLFLVNFGLSFIVALGAITLTAGRHAGFIYIAFLSAYWLYCLERTASKRTHWIVNSLLILQLAGGIFAVVKDIRHPFSNAYRVKELIQEIPTREKAVADYWTLNAISAFTDKPFYCIDLQREITYVLWNAELGEVLKKANRYFEGVSEYFQREGIDHVYMVSIASPEILGKLDSRLSQDYLLELIDKIEGSVEKAGNLYLYKISRR